MVFASLKEWPGRWSLFLFEFEFLNIIFKSFRSMQLFESLENVCKYWLLFCNLQIFEISFRSCFNP